MRNSENNNNRKRLVSAADLQARLLPGSWVNAFGEDVYQVLSECEEKCFRLNALPPSHREERRKLAQEIFGAVGRNLVLHSPFHCDFGINIRIGDHFVGNFNLTILDEAPVTIGHHVFIGPNTNLCTVTHALCAEQRNEGIMRARPITIGDNVWIAAHVTVLPGVSIGEGSVIGAGSVVTKDIPPYTLAVGNPCRVIRPVDEADKVQLDSPTN